MYTRECTPMLKHPLTAITFQCTEELSKLDSPTKAMLSQRSPTTTQITLFFPQGRVTVAPSPTLNTCHFTECQYLFVENYLLKHFKDILCLRNSIQTAAGCREYLLGSIRALPSGGDCVA